MRLKTFIHATIIATVLAAVSIAALFPARTALSEGRVLIAAVWLMLSIPAMSLVMAKKGDRMMSLLNAILQGGNSCAPVDYEDRYGEAAGPDAGGGEAATQRADGARAPLSPEKYEALEARYQEKLREAVAAAEEALVAKSSFLAKMSHEIRTPMNSIIGFSELAMGEELSSKSREYLGLIIENSQGLLHVINDILDLSKVESGVMELENTPFSLRELVNRCKAAVLPKAEEKNIELLFSTEAVAGKIVYGDPTRLRQVLENLVANAVKFTEQGSVKLSVTPEKETEDHITLRFEVSDSGIGFTPEQKEKLFVPFIHEETSTVRRYGGSSLGLPIAKNIVGLMGGELEIDSEPGVGTTARFTLAFGTGEQSEGTKGNNRRSRIERPMFKGDILICEDNLMNQLVIDDHLKRVGLEAEIVENGWKGVESVRRRIDSGLKPYDLILMDIHMPLMGGLEATLRIKQLGTETPIVAMTANIMAEDLEKYNLHGMSDCIGKPFTSQELWQCLMKYIEPARPPDEVAKESGSDELRPELSGARDEPAQCVDAQPYGGWPGTRPGAALPAEAKPDEDEEEAPPCNAKSPWGVIDKLEPLLKSGNPECLKLIDDLEKVPGSDKMILQMKEFYFGAASELLDELKKSLGLTDRGA